MADLALAGHEILGFDTVMPEYSVHQEAAALGSRVDWGDRDMMPDARTAPSVGHITVLTTQPPIKEEPWTRQRFGLWMQGLSVF